MLLPEPPASQASAAATSGFCCRNLGLSLSLCRQEPGVTVVCTDTVTVPELSARRTLGVCWRPVCLPPATLPHATVTARYYPVYTRRLNTAIKGNRAILLLLPLDVVQSVKVGSGLTRGGAASSSRCGAPGVWAVLAQNSLPVCRV
jgi:hypothetical protein